MPKLPQLYLSARLYHAKKRILATLPRDGDLTFVRSHGNVGDQLIEMGIRNLLQGYSYRDAAGRDLGDACGHTAVVAGGGAWCSPYHEFMPLLLPEVERRFKLVVVLPSSFDVHTEIVADTLKNTRATVFARESESYRQVRSICNCQLAHDCALYADLQAWSRPGSGILNAFRTDRESRLLAMGKKLPMDNNDISDTAVSLDEWLRTISLAEVVRTDRAHVMIAAAVLGKRVEFVASSYHKIPAIAHHSLFGFSVRQLSPNAL